MDTRSKSYSHLKIFKLIAFILVVISFASMVIISLNTIDEYRGTMDLLKDSFEENYYASSEYQLEIIEITEKLISLTDKYKSEEYIKSGQTVDQEELERLEKDLFNEYLYEREIYTYDNNSNYDNVKNEKLKKEFQEEFQEEIIEIKDNLINQDLKNFKEAISSLQEKQGLLYYVKQGDLVFSNTSKNSVDDFEKYPAHVIIGENENIFAPKEYKDSKDEYLRNIENLEGISKLDKLQLAFTRNYLNERVSAWNQDRNMIKDAMYKFLIVVSVLILALLYLSIVTGKESLKDKDIKLTRVDKLYTDINIILIIGIISIWATISGALFYSMDGKLRLIFISINSLVSCTLVLILLLSLIRHLKNRTIISHSLLSTLIKKIYELIKDIYNSGSVAVKVAVIVVIYSLIVMATFFMLPITIALGVYFSHKKVKEYMEIKKGVENIKNGEIDYKIEIDKEGDFKLLAEDINSIGEGFNRAIFNELKSERLKTELIANVSHDIRTPLTSIITYVDLIKEEEDNKKLNEYIEIIDKKSKRLKTLTDDLFEAAKATSGNIPVNYEKIDLLALITQGLGELDEQVKKSKLEFKINDLKEKVYVRADGKLVWRSIENLLTNIFKYSLDGSRVYIDLVDLGEEIELNIKNVSAYELNISSDELMERFTRGDSSRTSEGSGLGLSISKSLIEAQGGRFEISIDGDLFKVKITLNKS